MRGSTPTGHCRQMTAATSAHIVFENGAAGAATNAGLPVPW
jgi:hypothetical protein